MKNLNQLARYSIVAALLGLSWSAAKASTLVDDRLTAYGERPELFSPGQAPAVASMTGGVQVADLLLGSDIPVNPLYFDDRFSGYGERHDVTDAGADSGLAGNEDLSINMPPTAAGNHELDGYESDMNAEMTTD